MPIGSTIDLRYLIAKNKPSKTKIYDAERDNQRCYDGVAENNSKNEQVSRNSSSITKISRSPGILHVSFTFAKEFLLQMEYDKRNYPR